MMTSKQGNILKELNITNTVNLVGAMGAGLAKQVATAYPDCVAAYRQALRDGALRHGTVVSWKKPDGGHILQVPTKVHWKDKSPLGLVRASVRAMLAHAHALGITELHTVPLGCGLGGLDWHRQVRPLLEEAARDYPDVHVVVHE